MLQAVIDVQEGRPVCSLAFRGTTILDTIQLGLELEDGFRGGFAIIERKRFQEDITWKPVWGERSTIRDHHAGLRLTLRETDTRGRTLDIEFRAYDEGLAFRYHLPSPPDARWEIRREATEYRFPPGSGAFAIQGTEDTFPKDPIPLDRLPAQVVTPCTVRLPGGPFVALHEAFVVHYPRAVLERRPAGALGIRLQGKAGGQGAFTTPWRSVLVAGDEAGLIERAHLTLNLNPPCAIADTGWIRPGLTISDHYNCMLKMPDLRRTIEVASRLGFRHLQLDWGWYGTEWPWNDADRRKFLEVNPSWASDPDWVANTRADPCAVAKGRVPYRPDWKDAHTVVDLDIPALVAHAREHGMQVCLYMHGDVLRAHDMDRLFAIYRSWGIAGLKPGFVRYGTAEQTDWIRSMVEAAARHHLWLCVHDAHIPDGMERTYPNLMITEGGGGQEGNHPVHQDVIMPFTRCLAGPFDYTPHIYAKNKSHAHGMAFFVVFPGPTTVVRGGIKESATSGPEHIGAEVEFMRRVPMVWDETRVLDARIGHHIVTARRKGDAWFIGGMTGDEPHVAPIRLDFLASDRAFTATIFRDDTTETDGRRPAVKEVRTVKTGDRLDIPMAKAGGLAVIIEP
jgi:alpha-glucosidase